jgi:hypothetical protein
MGHAAPGKQHAEEVVREEDVVIMERVLDEELPSAETSGAIEGFESGSYAGALVDHLESGRT